ncbi:MAG TPA: multiheme c-type cytochrome [Polyangiales bacterium]|nr:multiheme c-type cytochrome [Polyangiales bacterium]
MRPGGVVGVLALLAAVGVAGMRWERARANSAREQAQAHRPIAVQADGYVSSNACRSCHAREYATWAGSYHRTMTQVATPSSVLGDFHNQRVSDAPIYTVERDGDRFLFGMADDASQPLKHYPVTLVTGSHHMQIYWYEMGDSRKLGQLPYVYMLDDKRWVPRATVFLEPPAPKRKPDESGRWSAACINCHTTQGQPRIGAESHSFDSQVAEFGIACEACHGPGERHVQANTSPLARYQKHLSDGDRAHAEIVQPKRLDKQRASEICSQCHSLWQDNTVAESEASNLHGAAYRPGSDAADKRWLVQPSHSAKDPRVAAVVKNYPRYVEGQFWPDGMARVSGREYSGMIDSPCFVAGEMSCLSCHNMHKKADDPRTVTQWADDQLAEGMDGDRACTQCHKPLAEPAALTAHTKHSQTSDGSRCYNCHMPRTSYGLLKSMHSHKISVPSVAETSVVGRPNACNLCHLDKSLGWTATQLKRLYDLDSPELSDEYKSLELSLLMGVRGDAGQRALIAGAIEWKAAQRASAHGIFPALLGVLMDDPYDAVRYMAGRALKSLPEFQASSLDFDPVPRPETRPPFAPRAARLSDLPHQQADRVQQAINRLLPSRDQRAVMLLE